MTNYNIIKNTFLYSKDLWLSYGVFLIAGMIDILIFYVCLYTLDLKGIVAFLVIIAIISLIKKKTFISTILKDIEEKKEKIFNSPLQEVRYGAYLFQVIFIGTFGFGLMSIAIFPTYYSALNKSFTLGVFGTPYFFCLGLLGGTVFGLVMLGVQLITYKFEKKKVTTP